MITAQELESLHLAEGDMPVIQRGSVVEVVRAPLHSEAKVISLENYLGKLATKRAGVVTDPDLTVDEQHPAANF